MVGPLCGFVSCFSRQKAHQRESMHPFTTYLDMPMVDMIYKHFCVSHHFGYFQKCGHSMTHGQDYLFPKVAWDSWPWPFVVRPSRRRQTNSRQNILSGRMSSCQKLSKTDPTGDPVARSDLFNGKTLETVVGSFQFQSVNSQPLRPKTGLPSFPLKPSGGKLILDGPNMVTFSTTQKGNTGLLQQSPARHKWACPSLEPSKIGEFPFGFPLKQPNKNHT